MHNLLLLVVFLGWILFLFFAWWLALPIYLAGVAVTLIIYLKIMKAQRSAPVMNEKAMIGRQAEVIRAEGNELDVQYGGEIWHATSETPVQPGGRVVITGVEGLVLRVSGLPPQESPAR